VTRIDLLETEPAARAPGVLYRALRPDVGFPYVAVDEAGDGYAVVREHGTPDVAGGVVLVNPFAVPGSEDDSFLADWDAAQEALAPQQGYLGTRLHRATGSAELRFVELARWSSPLMVARAVARQLPLPSEPALYQPLP